MTASAAPAGPAAPPAAEVRPTSSWAAAARYFARRLAQLAATLLVASVVIYGSVYLAPGDPASFLAGGRALSPAALAAIRAQYHLGKPFPVQYWDWLTGVMHGNLGLSVQFRQPVAGLIASRIPVTAFLCVYAAVLVLAGGMLLGAAGALAGRRLDQFLTVLLAAGAAVPSFVASLGLIYALAIWSHVFPSGGLGIGFTGQLDHMTLPAIALALAFLAVVARVTRQAMRDQARREHVDMAVSRGLPRLLVVRRHIFWNALAPVSTVSALVVAGLITGTTVVEATFGLNGVGSLLVSSVQSKDFPVVQGIVLLLVAVYVVLNTLVDLGYALINPQIRAGGQQ